MSHDKVQHCYDRCVRLDISFAIQPCLTPELLSMIFTSLPVDSTVFHMGEDFETGCYFFIIASKSFKKVEEGSRYPRVMVHFEVDKTVKKKITKVVIDAPWVRPIKSLVGTFEEEYKS